MLSALNCIALLAVACGSPHSAPGRPSHLVATVRSEPRSFNRLVATDRTSALVSSLVHGRLVRINGATHDVEPWIAESWSVRDEGRTILVKLRPDVKFSDGASVTSSDVTFSVDAVFDPRVVSPLATVLAPGGHPIQVTALDERTVRVDFAIPYGPGVRVLESLPILPRHKLEPALRSGSLREAWTTAAPVQDIIGAGPFALARYVPGQRVEFTRNPHYWRRDADGGRLPLVDELTLEIVPDQNAELLRLETGEAHLVSGELRPEDRARVERLQGQGHVRVLDLGVGLDPDALWFNLTPAFARREPARAKWMQRVEFRRAVSRSVDRRALVATIFQGDGVPLRGPITPGNRSWHDPSHTAISQDVSAARELLDGLDLIDRNGDGVRESADGEPVHFALLTHRGNAFRERTAEYLKHDLAGVGIRVDVVALDTAALVARLSAGDFDAALFVVQSSDTDPSANLDFWRSSGAFHLWSPSQPKPSTAWEAQLDALMDEQQRLVDPLRRREVFHRVLRVFDENEPVLYFAAPQLRMAASAKVSGLQPGNLQPYLLWNADSLALAP